MPEPTLHPLPVRLLAIAGSDSSGGAGIQADIKTAAALGAYAMTAITAVTAQDTVGVHAVQLMPPDLVAAQIRACLGDIGADAIKIGMLGSGKIAAVVVETLRTQALGIPVVLDPVLASTSGTILLDETGVEILREHLIPLTALVTPNIPEAELLTGIGCADDAGIRRAGEALLAMGAKAVLIKGGHGRGENLVDTLITREGRDAFAFPRIDSPHTHGTGCTYATAIAVGLAEGRTLEDAIMRAVHYLRSAIETAPGLGRGHGPLDHMHATKR
jgi:hydroxymethylpyrimidine/phosphomethylpyrimidine kinase